MATQKATNFVLTITLLPPCIFIIVTKAQNAPGLALVLPCVLVYTWVIAKIVVPFFTGPLRSLPHPPDEHWILAHGRESMSKPPGARFLQWMKTVPNDGLIGINNFLFFRKDILLTTPEALIEVLNTRAYDYQKPAIARRFLKRILGRGLIVVEGKEHKVQRKSVAPAFQGRVIKELIPIFWRKSCEFVNVVATEAQIGLNATQKERSGVVEINSVAQRITLDIIGVAVLGREFNTLTNSDDELAQQYSTILDPERGNVFLYLAINIIFPGWLIRKVKLWKHNYRIANAAFRLREICAQLLADKKAALKENPGKDIDILSVLMRSGSFDDDGLISQLLTFLAAGHETTSSALTWCCYLLATNPAIQQQLRSEVLAHTEGGELDATSLDSMKYLNAVCNETLRLYPTVPVTARTAIRQTAIGSTVVPKGSDVIISPWAINRLEKLWGEDAGTFNPDRWLYGDKSSTGGSNTTFSLITFLHGPRSCIGQVFAREELKCLLAAFVRRFRLEMLDPNEIMEPAGLITIKPKNGLHLKLTDIA